MSGYRELQTAPQETKRTTNRMGLLAAGLALGLFCWAGTTQANDNFESGFEHQLGHIAASHVATVAHLLFFGLHPRPVVVHQHYVGCGHRHDRAKSHHPVRHYNRHDYGHDFWRHGRHNRHQTRYDYDRHSSHRNLRTQLHVRDDRHRKSHSRGRERDRRDRDQRGNGRHQS